LQTASDVQPSLARQLDAGKLRKLRPAFKEGGSVTAGNSSGISDGAAALVLVSGATAKELGLHVIAKICGYADAAQVCALCNLPLFSPC
jgi:acetyl-CoA C-acetyltransferase